MTEAEWLSSIDPADMFPLLGPGLATVVDEAAPEINQETLRDFLLRLVTGQKLRLFGCACCRRIWPLLSDERVRGALEIAERFLEAQATKDELKAGSEALWDARNASQGSRRGGDGAATHLARVAANAVCGIFADREGWAAEESADAAVWGGVSATITDEWEAQAVLLRDIFGNPFRPVAVAPEWLAWAGGTVGKLAQAAYDERLLPSGHLDPARLAVLADALEDAGCTDQGILGHLRSPGPHVRGCWALDLLSGKE